MIPYANHYYDVSHSVVGNFFNSSMIDPDDFINNILSLIN